MNTNMLLRYTSYDDMGNKVWIDGKITEEFAQYYAKSSCSCYGRGKKSFDNPKTGMQWDEVCDCVIRAYKKEEQALLGKK